jgi:glutathione peroxidase
MIILSRTNIMTPKRSYLHLPYRREQFHAAVMAGVAAIALFWTSLSLAEDCPPLLNHQFPSLTSEASQDLCQYRGKVLLVVNTASYCGNTGQYEGLEALYSRYRDQGLVVLGFPSNDFGGQEPGSNKQIAKFCRLTYGVQFPMFGKSSVIGPNRNAFYRQLEEQTGKRPQWNFHKYLIDRDGRSVMSFEHSVQPDDPRFLEAIRARLDARKLLKRMT